MRGFMNKIKNRVEFKRTLPGVYMHLQRHNKLSMLDKYFKPISARKEWSFEDWVRISKTFHSISELKKVHGGLVCKARRNNWFLKFTPFPQKIKMVMNLDTNEIFKNSEAAAKHVGMTQSTSSSIRATCRGLHKTTGGYRWAYCDDQGKPIKSMKYAKKD